MRTEEYAIEQRARRIGIAVDTLFEIENKVAAEICGGDGESDPVKLHKYTSDAVAIYCAHLVAESQK
jgi:hypothetical protein